MLIKVKQLSFTWKIGLIWPNLHQEILLDGVAMSQGTMNPSPIHTYSHQKPEIKHTSPKRSEHPTDILLTLDK